MNLTTVGAMRGLPGSARVMQLPLQNPSGFPLAAFLKDPHGTKLVSLMSLMDGHTKALSHIA